MKERDELHIHRLGNRRTVSILQRNGLFGEWNEVNVAFSQVKPLMAALSKITTRGAQRKVAYKIGKTLQEDKS